MSLCSDRIFITVFILFLGFSEQVSKKKNTKKQYAKMQLEIDSSVILEKVLQAYWKYLSKIHCSGI